MRKTARLMEWATEVGARLGTSNIQIIEGLRQFGLRLGIAFQIRDDLLGIWATHAESGKLPAGDLVRRKKTLPVVHAFQHTGARDQAVLQAIYRAEVAPSPTQVEHVLAILDRAQSRVYCQNALAEQCQMARDALKQIPLVPHPLAQESRADLLQMVDYVEADLWPK